MGAEKTAAALLASMFCGCCAYAAVQGGAALPLLDSELPVIESEGLATVETNPDYVEYRMHFRGRAETLSGSIQLATAFETRLKEELETRELSPIDATVWGPTLPDLSQPEAQATARLRFSTGPFRDLEEGPGMFAQLCEAVMSLGQSLGASVSGPTMGVLKEEPLRQAAVERAVEEAYSDAEAAARINNAQIVAVQRIQILSVSFGDRPDAPGVKNDYRRLPCTARVRVTYSYLNM